MKTHISKVVGTCYHQLRRIHQVHQLVGQDVAQQLVSAFIFTTRLLQLGMLIPGKSHSQVFMVAEKSLSDCTEVIGTLRKQRVTAAVAGYTVSLSCHQNSIYSQCTGSGTRRPHEACRGPVEAGIILIPVKDDIVVEN